SEEPRAPRRQYEIRLRWATEPSRSDCPSPQPWRREGRESDDAAGRVAGCLPLLHLLALVRVLAHCTRYCGITKGSSTLRKFITRHIVTLRLMNNGTTNEPNWTCEFLPFVPPNAALRCLLGENPKEGSLLTRVPPATPGRGCS